MCRYLLLPGESVDRCYTGLLIFSFIGAFAGVLCFPSFVTEKAFRIVFSSYSFGHVFLSCFFPYSVILLSSLTAYGCLLIPLVFTVKSFVSALLFGAVLQSNDFTVLYSLLICELPGLFSFFLVGGLTGAFAWNNAKLIKNGQAAFSIKVLKNSVPPKPVLISLITVLVSFTESVFKFF